jgi:hypothetical protein
VVSFSEQLESRKRVLIIETRDSIQLGAARVWMGFIFQYFTISLTSHRRLLIFARSKNIPEWKAH